MTPFEADWARCAPWLEAALEHGLGSHTLEDVKAQVLEGDAHFWPGRSSAVVTEFHLSPRIKGLHFWLCGGDLAELTEDMRPVIEAWGRDHGCTRFTTAGRNGWQRVMARHGYEPAWHICKKDITP